MTRPKQTTERFVKRIEPVLGDEHPFGVWAQLRQHDDGAQHFDMHYELEMGVVLEGTMERFTRDTPHVCRAGDIWFCGMWEPHGFRCVSECRRAVTAIWPPALDSLRLPEAGRMNWLQPFILPPPRRPVVPNRLRNDVIGLVHHHLREGQEMNWLRNRLLVMDLLLFLFENDLVQETGESSSQPKGMDRIAKATELAFGSRKLVTNAEAAKACGLSCDVFMRDFRDLMGVSFSQFAARHRLSHAAEQLRETQFPVKAIAREWGFTDESHLYRLFKQHYGCTPSVYRQAHRP